MSNYGPFMLDKSDVGGDAEWAVWAVPYPNCIAQGPDLSTAFDRLFQMLPGYIQATTEASTNTRTYDSAVTTVWPAIYPDTP